MLLEFRGFCLSLTFSIFFWTSSSHAFFVDLGLLYYTDTLTSTGNSTLTTRNNYEFGVGFSVSKSLSVGWNYGSVTTSDSPAGGGSATTFVATDMGPRILYLLSKDKTWIFDFSYNLISTATFTPGGGTAQKWRGAALKIDIGYMPALSETFSMGVKLNYYSPTYTETIINSTSYATTVNSRNQIYPSISFLYMFQ